MRKFREAVQSDTFSISAELTLKRETTASEMDQQIDVLGEIVDGIQITDSPWSWVQMSPVAASAILLKRGVDPIPRLTCRDRNRIALHSELIGLRAMGVTSLLLTRGHRVPKKHYIPAETVFDTTGRELIDLFVEEVGTDHPISTIGRAAQAKLLRERLDFGVRKVSRRRVHQSGAGEIDVNIVESIQVTQRRD